MKKTFRITAHFEGSLEDLHDQTKIDALNALAPTPDIYFIAGLLRGHGHTELSERLIGTHALQHETVDYTVWCIEDTGLGTTWIGTVSLPAGATEEQLTEAAKLACAGDWEYDDPSRIHVLGAALPKDGDVNILFWNDLNF